ncbi:F-box/kelch-repeat protein At3g06240-like [Silene latifolia]|uniref:F-box/kelch-repeat protein At3g06240-like n=1 Tax=Silene latifolia TaxID=37657 RepID=UPI003D78AA2F
MLKNMKHKITGKSSSINNKHITPISEFKYIPPELWTLVFVNSPAKTLVTFRSVCKSWCSIIDHPDFIYLHLKLRKRNSDNHKLLLAIEGFGRGGYLLTVREADTFRKTTQIFMKTGLYSYCLKGSCNGLLLVRQYHAPYFLQDLRLWNPCIRKSLLIPKCPLPSSFLETVNYVFGFSPVCKDYKVVAIAFDQKVLSTKPANMFVAVYTLSDQQWTVRNNGLNIDSSGFNRMFGDSDEYRFPSMAVFFQGAAYWIGYDPSEDIIYGKRPTHLVSFDFDSEKFNYLELPNVLEEKFFLRFVFLLRDSLAIFGISSFCSSIWVLEKGAWTQRFSGNLSLDGYRLFSYCKSEKTKIFYCESDGGYFMCEGTYYNIVSCQTKVLRRSMSFYLDLEEYSESLVLCKGYGAQDLRFFT